MPRSTPGIPAPLPAGHANGNRLAVNRAPRPRRRLRHSRHALAGVDQARVEQRLADHQHAGELAVRGADGVAIGYRVPEVMIEASNPSGDLQEIEPPLDLGGNYYRLLIVVSIMGALAAAAYLVLRRYESRRKNDTPVPYEIPAIDEFLARMQTLRARGLVEEGRREEYVVEASRFFRMFLSRLIGIDAMEMTGLELADALERIGVPSRVQTAIEMRAVAETYIRLRAISHLEKGRVVILAAGTGNPYFTTDTAAALRAMEIDADLVIKATKVDGVYAEDPLVNPNAQRFDHLTYIDALNMRVGVLDSTAISLCMDNHLPIVVLDLWQPGALIKAVTNQSVGTIISH